MASPSVDSPSFRRRTDHGCRFGEKVHQLDTLGTMPSRAATAADVDHLARTITLAFASDPIWAPALSRSDGTSIDLEPYWRLFVEGALRFGTAHLATDGAAVSIWIPPGEAELSDAQVAALDELVADALDPPAVLALHQLFERFEASRAGRPDHYYLSLLAAHPDFRGLGRGQILLAENLAQWDAAGIPSYLESTNPANDHRYVRAGFRSDGGFRAVRDDAWVTLMWRPVGGS
jgi:GNAT superfamily N-acetyltransferase